MIANLEVGEKEREGLIDMAGMRRGNRSEVTMFQKVLPYQQSIKDIVQYQRLVPLGTTTLPLTRD